MPVDFALAMSLLLGFNGCGGGEDRSTTGPNGIPVLWSCEVDLTCYGSQYDVDGDPLTGIPGHMTSIVCSSRLEEDPTMMQYWGALIPVEQFAAEERFCPGGFFQADQPAECVVIDEADCADSTSDWYNHCDAFVVSVEFECVPPDVFCPCVNEGCTLQIGEPLGFTECSGGAPELECECADPADEACGSCVTPAPDGTCRGDPDPNEGMYCAE